MDRLTSILEYIVAAIEDGRIAINIYNDSDEYEQTSSSASMLPMLVSNLDEFIRENHSKLHKQFEAPIAICENGDVLFRTNSKGLDYYKDNKVELYTDIYLKSGASRIYVYAADIDECWVQIEKDNILKDIGQIPNFGTQPPMQEQDQPLEENDYTNYLETPLLTIEELVSSIPTNLLDVKLYAADIGQIIRVIQERLTTMTLENIETAIYERNETET